MHFVVGQMVFNDVLLFMLMLFLFSALFSFSSFKIMLIFSVHLLNDLEFYIDEHSFEMDVLFTPCLVCFMILLKATI